VVSRSDGEAAGLVVAAIKTPCQRCHSRHLTSSYGAKNGGLENKADEIFICTECGQAQGQWPLTERTVTKEENDSVEEELDELIGYL